MMEEDWNDAFYDLFREAVGRYHEGHRNVDGFFTDQEIIFLSSIGCRTRELFDFVETYARTGEPSPTTVLLMAARAGRLLPDCPARAVLPGETCDRV